MRKSAAMLRKRTGGQTDASCETDLEKVAAACHAAPLARGARIGILIAIRTGTFAEKIGLKPFFNSAQLRLEIIVLAPELKAFQVGSDDEEALKLSALLK